MSLIKTLAASAAGVLVLSSGALGAPTSGAFDMGAVLDSARSSCYTVIPYQFCRPIFRSQSADGTSCPVHSCMQVPALPPAQSARLSLMDTMKQRTRNRVCPPVCFPARLPALQCVGHDMHVSTTPPLDYQSHIGLIPFELFTMMFTPFCDPQLVVNAWHC
jgi:hypothetical protein